MIDEGGLPSLVVDNSVAIKWYLPEDYAEEAMSVFYAGRDGEVLLFAPDLIYSEFGNALWRHHRSGKLSLEEVRYYWSDFGSAPIYTFEIWPLVPAALEIATECDCTVYDALYVALAETQREEEGREGAVVITADEKSLLDKLKGTPYEDLVAHIRDAGNFISLA